MTIIGYFMQTGLCMGIFYVFYCILLKNETTFHANRFYLIGTLFISLIFPLIQFPVDIIEFAIPDGVGLIISGDGRQIKSGEILQAQTFNWINVFLAIYLTGAMIYLYRLAKAILELRTIKELGIPVSIRGYNCIFSTKVQTPFSFLKNIYLPAHRPIDEEELVRIINHESVHIEEKHFVDIMFFELIKIVFWINPFVYLYQRRMKELHEFIADADVISQEGRDGYCDFLIKHLNASRIRILTSQLAQSPLKSRFIMMTRKPSTGVSKWKYAATIPLVIFSFLIFSCNDSNQSLSSPALTQEPSPALEITITEDNHYQVKSKSYGIDEMEKLLMVYKAETRDPLVNVRMANPSSLTVGDIGKLLGIGLDLHLNMILHTNN